MAIKIEFDDNNMPIVPTFILSRKNGDAIGVITNLCALTVQNTIDVPNVTFQVYKDNNGMLCGVWDDLTDFKLAYCIEWDTWFELTVTTTDGTAVVKNVTGTHLPQSELSQIMLFNIEINTEDDIAREDYTQPTIVFNQDNADASLLHRILRDKAPHYSIYHVDDSLINLQRTFSFNSVSIKDALDEIAEELNAVVIYGESDSTDRVPKRTISLYDLSYMCNNCGYRGNIFDTCPQCGSTNITHGYGNDTTIFVTKDNLTDEVEYSVDTDNVKNCFRLEAGDDLMTATVINCNPNGTQYYWYFSNEMKNDMPTALVSKLTEYDALYQTYYNTYQFSLNASKVSSYNTLVTLYDSSNYDSKSVPANIVGFQKLTKTLYDVLDFKLYLSDGMLPTISTSDTTAALQAALLINTNLSPIAVSNYNSLSATTADSYVLEMAKIVVNSRYEVRIKESTYDTSTHIWTGIFTVTNYSDEEDTAESATCTLTLSDDYKTFVTQKIEKVINKNEVKDYSLSSILAMSVSESGGTYSGDLVNELKKYNLTSLKYILSACQSVIDVLIEQGIGNDTIWTTYQQNLYNQLYYPYYIKLKVIESEISKRDSEIALVDSLYNDITNFRAYVQSALNLQKYLGNDLWLTLCSYRREDSYNNTNFVSDGLDNAQLCENAKEFLAKAEVEIIKSATSQHKITSTFKNLLTIKEFSKLVDYFELWNWIRVEADGEIFKLRLISYDIDFDDLEKINVEFSDIIKGGSIASDSQSIFNSLTSISTSYDYVAKKSETGYKANLQVKEWASDGFSADATPIVNNADNMAITMDKHGMLFREYNEVEDVYSPTQLKIINSTLAITSDGWATTKAAIGLFKYIDPSTGNIVGTYGVNGETIIGKLILGNSLGIYNTNSSLKFNANGLMITNGLNTFTVNPNNNQKLLSISNTLGDVLWVDSNGALNITGAITATSGTIGGITANNSYGLYTNSKTNSTSTNTGFLISKDGAIYLGAYNSTSQRCPFQVDASGNLTALSATITGTINATSGTFGASNATNKITIGTNTTNASIYYGMTSLSDTTHDGFYIGADGIALGKGVFKVTNAGVLTSTSGTIGGVSVNSSYGLYTNSKTSATSTNTGFLISKDGSIYLGAYSSSTSSCPFQVTSSGALTARNATIIGNITATSAVFGVASATNKISLGTGTTNSSFYFGMTSLSDTSHNGFYLGTDGIALGKGKVKIEADGDFQFGGSNGITYNASTGAISLGSDVSISWNSVSNQPTIPTVPSDVITNTNKSTYITKTYIDGLNVIAENISGTTITGKTISGGQIQIGTAVNSVYPFQVSSAGVLTATGASVTGTLTSTGTISVGSNNISGKTIVGSGYARFYAGDNLVGTIWPYAWDNDTTNKQGVAFLANQKYLGIGAGGIAYIIINNGLNPHSATENIVIDGSLRTRYEMHFGNVSNTNYASLFYDTTDSTLTVGEVNKLCIYNDSTGSTYCSVMNDNGDMRMVVNINRGIYDNTAGFQNWLLEVDNSNENVILGHSNYTGQLRLMNSKSSVFLGAENEFFAPITADNHTLGTSTFRWEAVYAKNTTIQTSDRKNKDILGDITFAHDLIMSLEPKAYMWKDGDHRRTRMGFIAQDVAQICKNMNKNLSLVTASYTINYELGENDPNYKKGYYGEEVDDEKLDWGMAYDELIAPMVKVIQEQERRIASLEAIINAA